MKLEDLRFSKEDMETLKNLPNDRALDLLAFLRDADKYFAKYQIEMIIEKNYLGRK